MVKLRGERELFVGAKVTIDEGSPYWNENDKYNPRGIVGRVTGVTSEEESEHDIWWGVYWSNGHSNSYEQGDLKVLGEVVNSES